jgi:uncharacterized protein involved in exopolysaccharide biosynthesis/Mrp family chromosome partitioning ATPase
MSTETRNDRDIEFSRFLGAMVRQRWLLLGVVALAVGLGTLLTVRQTPIYRSEATLLIEQERRGLDLIGAMLPGGLGSMTGLSGAGPGIQTDIAMLRSRQVVEPVVDSLALNLRLLAPRMPRDELFDVHERLPVASRAVYSLKHRGDGAYDLRLESGRTREPHPPRVQVGERFRIEGAVLSLQPSPGRELPSQIRIEVVPTRTAVERLRKNLKVVGLSEAQVLEIEYRSPDARFAAEVPNRLAASFIAYKDYIEKSVSNTTIGFLEEQVASYERDLRDAEIRLQAFREGSRIIEPRTQATEQVRRVAEMQAERDVTQAERQALDRLITRMEQGTGSTAAYRQLASFPTFVANVGIHDVLRTLNELETERSRLAVRRTDSNDEVRTLDTRIRELELQLFQFARSYRTELDSRLASMDALLGTYTAEMQTIPAREVELLRLTREQKLLEEVFTLIQTKLKDEQIQVASGAGNVRVMDSALVPRSPASPNLAINLTLATVLGLVLGSGLVLIREVRDRRLRTPADASGALGGAPVLGVIPASSASSGKLRRIPVPGLLRTSSVGRLLSNPAAGGMDGYRLLHTNLSLVDPEVPLRVLALVSAAGSGAPNPQIALNVAQVFARAGESVLLIDADLYGGELHRDVDGATAEPGLVEVLNGEVSLEEAIQRIDVAGGKGTTSFLAHGRTAGASPLSPVLLEPVVAAVRGMFSRVVLVTPSLDYLAAAGLVARTADATLVVARLGVTDRDELADAAGQLARMKVRLAGVIVDEAQPSRLTRA